MMMMVGFGKDWIFREESEWTKSAYVQRGEERENVVEGDMQLCCAKEQLSWDLVLVFGFFDFLNHDL